MLEEFGKYPENRDQFFGDVYNAVLASAMMGGPLKGVAFWQWYDDGQARFLWTLHMLLRASCGINNNNATSC